MEKVSVKNISGHKVCLTIPDLRINRDMDPGKSILLQKDILEDALTYPGVPELFDKKYLAILDTQAAIDVGAVNEDDLPEKDGVKYQEGIEDAAEILNIIENGTDFQLKKYLQSQNADRKREIANIAARSKNLTLSKQDVILKETGIDLTKILAE